MKVLNTIILLFFATILVGCGAAGKSSATLQVSQAFALTNPNFGGGLIIIGEGPNGKKFSIPLDTTKQATIDLDKGSWTFSVIGWDGGYSNYKFQGARHCGFTQVDLASTEQTVSLSASPAGCNDPAFIAAVDVRSITTNACGSFYNYNSVTNNWSDVEEAEVPAYCSDPDYPSDYRRKATYLRVFALAGNNGNVTTSFDSTCQEISVASLYLPTKKFPLMIKLYNSAMDCTNKVNDNIPYMFPNGLIAGNSNFDQIFFSGANKLLLSDSMTRRGKSPFMNMMPRILCNGADCLSDPVPTSALHVNWWGDYNDQLIAKKTTLTSVPTCQFTYPSQYFGISDCQLKDGNVYAKLNRNVFTCQEATSPFQSQDAAYVKGDKIYVLDNDNVDPYHSRITIYSLAGKKLTSVTANVSNLTNIAVDSNGNIFAANGTTTVRKWTSSNNFITEHSSLTFTENVDILDVDAGYIYVNSTANGVKSYLISAIGDGYISNIHVSNTIQDIRVNSNNIYVLSSDGTNSEIHKQTISSGNFSQLVLLAYAFEVEYSNFWVDGTSIAIVTSGGDVHNRSSSTGSITTPAVNSIAPPVAIIQKAGLNYVFASGGVRVHKETPGSPGYLTPWDNGSNRGSCVDNTSTFTAGAGAVDPLGLESIQDDAIYRIYETGLEFLGRRTLETPESYTYFPHLRDDDDDVRTGGYLGNITDMLGPKQIGGFFSGYSNCSALVADAVVAGGSITRSQTFVDPKDFSVKTYSATVSAFNEPRASFIRCDANPAGSCSPNNYDNYELLVNITGNNEKGRIKLNCGFKAGEFEFLESNPGQTYRNLTLWNTNTDNYARYEKYELADETNPTHTWVSLSKVQKSASNLLWGREVRSEITSGWIQSDVKELKLINDSGDKYITAAFHISETPTIYGNATNSQLYAQPSVLFDDVRDHSSFYTDGTVLGIGTNPHACISQGSTEMDETNEALNCESFATSNSTTMSKSGSLSLSIGSIWNVGTLPLPLSPVGPPHPLRAVFTLTLPP